MAQSGGNPMKIRLAVVLAIIMLLAICIPVSADNMDKTFPGQEENLDNMPIIIDILILRPAGLATCVIGLAASIIALPFALPSKSTDRVYKVLIEEPFYYTFRRPIGKSR